MNGEEEVDEFDNDEKGRPWMEALMERALILLTIGSLVLFFILIVF
ncbi:MAG: hypothetical protein WDO14_03030 [Bacteroidota bacterium]